MKRMRRTRITAVLMAVIMVFAMAPCIAFANETADQDTNAQAEVFDFDENLSITTSAPCLKT